MFELLLSSLCSVFIFQSVLRSHLFALHFAVGNLTRCSLKKGPVERFLCFRSNWSRPVFRTPSLSNSFLPQLLLTDSFSLGSSPPFSESRGCHQR